MTDEPQPTLESLKPKYEKLVETDRPAAVAALEQIQRDNATAQQCDARICDESNLLTNDHRKTKAEIAFDVFHNLASNLEVNAERQWRPASFILTLDRWHETFVENEWPMLERLERKAEIDVYKVDWDIADMRVQMAEAKLREDTVTLDQENGGIVVRSNLVDSLQQDLAVASRKYFTALDAYKDLVKRQDERRAKLASVGMITSQQISRAIPR